MGALKIIYIAGASFSGSTFLGAALSQHPDLMLAGELYGLIHSDRVHKCSCGLRYDQCEFWQNVLAIWRKNSPITDLKHYRKIAHPYERFRALPRYITNHLQEDPNFQIYAQTTRAFMQALSVVSGKSVIVDISKYPARALALSLSGLDVTYIHLIRSGLAYLDSNTRRLYVRQYQNKKFWPRWRFWLHSALEWDIVNLACEWTGKHIDAPTLKLRYEDYVRDPENAFEAIGHISQINGMKAYGQALKDGTTISFGHAMGGNLIRLQGETRLQVNSSWRERLTPTQKNIYTLFSWVFASRYGYNRQGLIKQETASKF